MILMAVWFCDDDCGSCYEDNGVVVRKMIIVVMMKVLIVIKVMVAVE